MIVERCCICRRHKPIDTLGPWNVPKLNAKDKGYRWACQGACSGELYRKVREHLRARAA
jgi:hypothetical protein